MASKRTVQFAPGLAHCVCGVGAEIQEHLVNMAGVGQDRPHTMVQVLLECDGRGQGRPQELERFLNQELELRGGTLLLGATAERENLLHESCCPLARLPSRPADGATLDSRRGCWTAPARRSPG